MDSENYRLKRTFSVIPHSPDIVELRNGVWNPTSFTLTDGVQSGRLFRLLSGLDGSVSPAQLAQREGVPQDEVESLLDDLIQLGVVERGPTTALDYYLDTAAPTLRPVPGEAPRRRRALVLGEDELASAVERSLRGSLPTTEIRRVLAGDPAWRAASDPRAADWLLNGIAFRDKLRLFQEWTDCFLIVATKIINPVLFRTINRVCLDLKIPWITAAIDGPVLLIGPTFVPQRSACYECFETRVVMNLRESASYQSYKRAIAERSIRYGDMPVEPAILELVASHCALESLNYLLTAHSFTVGKVLSVYLPTMEFTYNAVLRVPGCEGCDASSERDDKELYFDVRTLLGATHSESLNRPVTNGR